RSADGGRFWPSWVALSTEAPAAEEAMTEHEDSAELERVEQRLHESEELYRHVVELSSLIPWTADRAGRVIAVGERWREWTGTDTCEAMGSHWLEYAHPDDAPGLFAAWMRTVETGSRFESEWRVGAGASRH